MENGLFDRIIKKQKNLRSKLYIAQNEKVYENNGHSLRYLYCPCSGSKSLAVVFSAFPSSHAKAGYNMVTTFWNVKVNKLYILDNFGYQQRGAYYLSENKDFFIPPLVKELLVQFIPNQKKVCFLGSSKGGFSAMYYGLQLSGVDTILCGAPQYYLGDYLTCKTEHYPILDAMAGDHSPATVETYNKILPCIVKGATSQTQEKPLIYLHYSTQEPTYERHIKSLLCDLKRHYYSVKEDVQEYKTHQEVANYFPALCLKYLKSMEV